MGKLIALAILTKKPSTSISNGSSRKEPYSNEIQQIVEEIADTTKRNYEHYRMDTGINYRALLSNMTDIYLSSANKDMNVIDKKYGNGAARFIGESLKFYSENNK